MHHISWIIKFNIGSRENDASEEREDTETAFVLRCLRIILNIIHIYSSAKFMYQLTYFMDIFFLNVLDSFLNAILVLVDFFEIHWFFLLLKCEYDSYIGLFSWQIACHGRISVNTVTRQLNILSGIYNPNNPVVILLSR